MSTIVVDATEMNLKTIQMLSREIESKNKELDELKALLVDLEVERDEAVTERDKARAWLVKCAKLRTEYQEERDQAREALEAFQKAVAEVTAEAVVKEIHEEARKDPSRRQADAQNPQSIWYGGIFNVTPESIQKAIKAGANKKQLQAEVLDAIASGTCEDVSACAVMAAMFDRYTTGR